MEGTRMHGELSHGLPRLATAGNRIIELETSQAIMLRGVNRSGMEYAEPDHDGFVSAAGMSGAEFRTIAELWNANIVRIPFNQDWALRGRGAHDAGTYLRDLDRIIRWAASHRMYTLLDLQWLDADNSFGANRQFVPPLPNPSTPAMWEMLADRYRDEPAVLFDILNEPHDRMPDDPYPLWTPDGTMEDPAKRLVTMEEWQPWARRLIDAIRRPHPDALIFVSGVNWGYDLRGFPLDRPDLVYSTHVYRNKGKDWDAAFGNLSWSYPVFAAEWGGRDRDLAWGRDLAAYFATRGIGWAAWSWADEPHLVSRYAPTAFGELVRQACAAHRRRA
ncbi:MAG: cellulase family glycosylhydrolase [Bryobacteraceae bacterium]